MLYALGDFRSARGSSIAKSITGGQDIATYTANTVNTANTTNGGGSITTQPTIVAAVTIKNNSTNPKLLN